MADQINNHETPPAEDKISAPRMNREEAAGANSSRTLELERRLKETETQLMSVRSLLEKTEKMATVGRLVAEIAHEIKTPLGSIRSNNDILSLSIQRLRDWTVSRGLGQKENGAYQDLFSIIDDTLRVNQLACDRILKVVQGLHGSLQPDEAEYTKANIHEGIESALSLLGHELGRRIRVLRDFGPIPEIECYPGRLIQVFLNLLINAIQAIEGEGEIRVRTWEEGDAVRVAISDTGKGIPVELRSKIFDSGFTTRKAEGGTGLGLFICRNIVQQHGGRINVDSEPGKGATFTLMLPTRRTQERNTND